MLVAIRLVFDSAAERARTELATGKSGLVVEISFKQQSVMGDEPSDAMNLDLNLGPIPEIEAERGSGSIPIETVSLDELMEPAQRIREAVIRARQHRWRWRHLHIPPEAQNITMRLNQLIANSGNGDSLQAGEGSVPAEERVVEVSKASENSNGFLEEGDSDKKVDTEKGSGNDGSFFDCNICFDLAKDPVVTSCGHLFCWPCLYRWLHVFSDAKECPVCKGEVTIKNLTPIYGRGSSTHEPEDDSSLKIPVRPHARRADSFRQTIQRTALAFPVEEAIRGLENNIDYSHVLIAQQDHDSAHGIADRSSLLNTIFTSGMRQEQNHPVDIVDLTESGTTSPETWEHQHFHSGLLRSTQQHFHSGLLRSTQHHRITMHPHSSALPRRPQPHRETIFSPFTSAALSSAERNQEHALPIDDRDSFSSIAAVMNPESQTVEEIDSMVSLLTPSSRRRNDATRVSDVDSGDSHAPRRRRLH